MDVEEAIQEQLRDMQLIKEEQCSSSDEYVDSLIVLEDNYVQQLQQQQQLWQHQLPPVCQHLLSHNDQSRNLFSTETALIWQDSINHNNSNGNHSNQTTYINRSSLNQALLDLQEDEDEDSLRLYYPQNKRYKEAKIKAQNHENQLENTNNTSEFNNSSNLQAVQPKKPTKGFTVKSLVAIDVEKQKTNFEMLVFDHPSNITLNPLQGFYFLAGDVCIMSAVLKRSDFARFSGLNSFKSPIKTQTNFLQGTLQIDMNNKRSGLKNFEFIIEKLKNLCDQRHYEVAILLQEYQNLINHLQLKKYLINDSESLGNFTELLQQSYMEFLPKSEIFLKEISQEYTFYAYSLYRLNLLNVEMEMKRFGYSEALLALLGLDFQQASRFVWRRGLFDFLDKRNIENVIFQLISHILGNGNSKKTFDSTLYTFDGIDVYAKMNFAVFVNPNKMNQFLPYNEILHVWLFTISPTMIKQVIEIRQRSQEKNAKYIREIEEDLQYSMEAANFLEKYYNNTVDGFQPSSKRAKYRIINPEKDQQKVE